MVFTSEDDVDSVSSSPSGPDGHEDPTSILLVVAPARRGAEWERVELNHRHVPPGIMRELNSLALRLSYIPIGTTVVGVGLRVTGVGHGQLVRGPARDTSIQPTCVDQCPLARRISKIRVTKV